MCSSYYYYCVGSLLVVIFSFFLLLNNNGNYFEKSDDNIYKNENFDEDNDFFSFRFLQNSYAIEDNNSNGNSNEDNSDDNNKDKDDDASDKKKEEEDNNNKSLFNFVAVGDWDCNGETKDTVKNIIDQDPEVVLALGDLSYNGKAKCWLKLVEPIADKTKIVFGNHEDKLEDDYSEFFGLKEQYYSFNYKNVHFLALSTETDYDDESEQYQFAANDLEKYSKDPLIDWIIVFYHSFVYGSGSSLPEESDFRETYHPLFDKYKVDLALQGHFHVYERTYPISFNDDDDDEPIVNDDNPNIYKNPKGTVFVTVGTGGAQNMILSSREDFSAEGIDGKFGILDIALENDRHTLTGTFIENGKKKEVMDEFKIVK